MTNICCIPWESLYTAIIVRDWRWNKFSLFDQFINILEIVKITEIKDENICTNWMFKFQVEQMLHIHHSDPV